MKHYLIFFTLILALLVSCRSSRVSEESLASSVHREENLSTIRDLDLGHGQSIRDTREILAAMMDSTLTNVTLDIAWRGDTGEIHYKRDTKSGSSSQSKDLCETFQTDTTTLALDETEIHHTEGESHMENEKRDERAHDSKPPEFASLLIMAVVILMICGAVRLYTGKTGIGEIIRTIFRL